MREYLRVCRWRHDGSTAAVLRPPPVLMRPSLHARGPLVINELSTTPLLCELCVGDRKHCVKQLVGLDTLTSHSPPRDRALSNMLRLSLKETFCGGKSRKRRFFSKRDVRMFQVIIRHQIVINIQTFLSAPSCEGLVFALFFLLPFP